MRFQRLDLNLLVALDALLSERSVSLAADRICLSQSATSSALGRLREYFEDDLLVLKGRQMVLTPRGEELIEPVRAVLEQIRTTIAITPPFDPATSDRLISIAASDYATEVLLSAAVLEFSKEAPNMRFEITPLTDCLTEILERGHADLLMTVDGATAPDHPKVELFEDDFVVVGWSENDALTEPLSEERYFGLDHVMVKFGKSRTPSFVESFLQVQERERMSHIVAPSFISVAGFLVGTNRIATMHRRLARRMVRQMPLKMVEVPFEIPSMRLMAQWASSSSNDPAIRWVVDRLCDLAITKNNLSVVHGGAETEKQASGGPKPSNVRPGLFGQGPGRRNAS